MKNKKYLFAATILIFILLFLPVLAQDFEDEDEELELGEKDNGLQEEIEKDEENNGDIMFLGLELEKLISFISGIIATVLFFITFAAFGRRKTKRLFYVSIAFALYAIRSFLASIELFGPEVSWIDPTAVILDLIILMTFFYAILKK